MAVVATKCKNCGAELKYQPELQTWKCEFCDSTYTLDQLEHMDVEKQAEKSAQTTPEAQTQQESQKPDATPAQEGAVSTDGTMGDLVRYKCPYCHAEVVTAAETAATACVYCGRPLMIGETLTGESAPDFVIPFATTKEQATETFRQYIKKRPFLPKAFLDELQIQKITGMYVPFFLHDCTVSGQLAGKGDVIRTWSDSEYNYTETTTYAFDRAGDMAFSKIPTDASAKLDNGVIDSIEPFDYSKMVDFSSAYLAGFFAEKFTDSKENCFQRGMGRALNSINGELQGSCSRYVNQRISAQNQQITSSHTSYGMLPVWLLYTNYKEKDYLFAMNGQTGKFVGNLPIDKAKATWKTLLFALCTGAGLGVVVTLICWIGGLM